MRAQCHRPARFAVWLFLVSIALLPGRPAAADSAFTHHPNAELRPDQVVRIQLEALRANDKADQGIATCFRFASPSNKLVTGPVERFAAMLKGGVYALMFDYADVEYESVEVVEQQARQRVHLTGGGKVVTYVFYLSRQDHPECDGCWMTNSVDVEAVSQST